VRNAILLTPGAAILLLRLQPIAVIVSWVKGLVKTPPSIPQPITANVVPASRQGSKNSKIQYLVFLTPLTDRWILGRELPGSSDFIAK
jgi:hypothetical protein